MIMDLIFGWCCLCLVIAMFVAKYGHVEAVAELGVLNRAIGGF